MRNKKMERVALSVCGAMVLMSEGKPKTKNLLFILPHLAPVLPRLPCCNIHDSFAMSTCGYPSLRTESYNLPCPDSEASSKEALSAQGISPRETRVHREQV